MTESFWAPLPANEHVDCLLTQAWRLFQQKGFRGTSLDEICQQCTVTKPTLYYYFPDKEALYIQALMRHLRGLRQRVEQPGPLPQRLEALAAHILANFTTSIDHMLRDMVHVKHPAHHALVGSAFYSDLFLVLVDVLARGVAAGQLRPGDTRVYAWAFLGLVNTFAGRPEAGQPGALARMLVDLYLRGIQAAQAPLGLAAGPAAPEEADVSS
jgi:AcrR family transcriptional regulator